MTFPVGWDGLDRLTLRFVEPELERAYRDADQAPGVRRARTASLLAAGVWVLVALVGPPAVGIAAGSTWLIAGVMTVFLLGWGQASRWATTQPRRSLIGLGNRSQPLRAVLTLTSVTDRFAMYALPGMMLTAVFGFSVTRPPFVGSILLGVVDRLSFLAVAAEIGSRDQTFAAVPAACGNGGQRVGRGLPARAFAACAAYAQSRLVMAFISASMPWLDTYLLATWRQR